jgi:asparagine synthase (glutamine-hydrolysing)
MAIAGLLGASGGIGQILAALKLRPEDPLHSWQLSAGSMGICGAASFASSAPKQPDLLILLQGTIHDRPSLLDKLSLPGTSSLGAAVSDADLLLRAYLRYREEFPRHVTGEYSFALWDAQHRRLILGRDVFGRQGMYYWQSGSVFRFASEIVGLLACPEIPVEPDDDQAAQWLTMNPGLGDGTLYKGIRRVPAGHVLIIEDGTIHLNRYWRPEDGAELRCADPREYAEGLLQLMQESVRCRILPGKTIGTHLSGGLDSSTVTALAAEILAKEGRRATAFTAVPANSIDQWLPAEKFGDERLHAASVAELYPNLDHVLVPNNAAPLLEAMDFYAFDCHSPVLNVFNAPWLVGIGMEARRRDIHTLMHAVFGNLAASYDGSYALVGLLGRGRIFDWLRLIAERRNYGFGVRQSLGISLKYGPMRSSFRHSIARALHMDRSSDQPSLGLYSDSPIRPGFFKSSGLSPMLATNTTIPQKNSRLARLQAISRIDSAAVIAGAKRRFGYDFVDPMGDRRLFEYCLSLPEEAFCRAGRPRSLIRDAMESRLPSMVRDELRRGRQAADAAALMADNREQIVAEIRRLQRSDLANRYLDMPAIGKLIDDWPNGGWPNAAIKQTYEGKLLRAVSFGHFMRRMEDGTLQAAIRQGAIAPNA